MKTDNTPDLTTRTSPTTDTVSESQNKVIVEADTNTPNQNNTLADGPGPSAAKDSCLTTEEVYQRAMSNNVMIEEEIRELAYDAKIELVVVDSFEEFEAASRCWNQFQPDPMNSHPWNISWWRAFQGQGQLQLLMFQQAGRTVGFAPLYVDRWFGLKRLRFLATDEACTDYADLICDPNFYQSCADSLEQYIREQRFQVVELECTRDDRLTNLMKQSLADVYHCDHRNVEPSWILDLPETMKEFTSNAKKSLRRKINKANRRLESDEFTIKTSSSGEIEFAAAFEIFRDLHTRRWHSLNGPGIFGDEKFAAFIEAVATAFHQEQKCEIIVLYQDDKPIASQVYFISSKGYQLYQSGYDPDTMKLEPGHILFTSMVGRAIERGDKIFDFLRGDEPYKEYWGADALPQTKLRMIARRPFPRVIAKCVETARRLTRGS